MPVSSRKPNCVPYERGIPVAERLVEYIDFVGDCWLWIGHRNAKGYGRFRDALAHRVVYETFVETVPAGLQLDHLCRTPACVNPDHLELVTNAVNVRRGVRAKLTPETARAIRESSEPTRVLVGLYGISRSQVQKVRRGDAWTEAV